MTSPADPGHLRLPTTVTPSHYELRFAPDLDHATFEGWATTTITVHEPVDQVVLHALDLEITSVWVEQAGERIEADVALDPTTETATISLRTALAAGEALLQTRFSGVLNDKLVGFYRSTFTDSGGAEHTLACTQFESTHARRAFPCWDEPAFKASFSVTLDVADTMLAVSNASESGRQPLGDGKVRVTFAPTMVMSTYLVAFVVGPLEVASTTDVDGVELRVITPPDKTGLAAFAAEVGAFSLRFLADWYDIAYPGDKVDLIAIPDFAFGAMENLGCITFRETALLLDPATATQAEQQRVADVIAHELAHMWFGDLVTMGWWNGIWLNEAFATFMEVLTVDAFRPGWERWVDFGTARSAAFDTDSLTTTRPIEFEVVDAQDAEAMFDVLTYEKGASVVRMLQQYLGDDRFQAGIRHYLRTHAYGNTETTDLWDAIESVSGEPVRHMMDTWIFHPGHPMVSITADEDGVLTLSHRTFTYLADPESGRVPVTEPVQIVPAVLRVADGDEVTEHRIMLDGSEATLAVGSSPTWIVGNNGANGFYRVELPDAELARTIVHAPLHLTAAERYALLEDEWALVLAGKGSLQRVTAALRVLATDTDLSVTQKVIGVLGGLDRLMPDPHRDRFASYARSLLAPALTTIGPIPVVGEAERTSARRAALFEATARLGRDRNQIERARRWFEAMGEPGHRAEAGADLADATVRVVAANADRETWDEIRRRAGLARSAQDSLRHHGALADAPDPSLVLKLAEIALTDEIRTQDGAFVLRRALANRHAHRSVWGFVEDRWDDLTDRFPSSMIPRLLEGIRPVNDRETARRIQAFVSERAMDHGSQVINQHLERMWVSVSLAERMSSEVEGLLS